MNLFFFLVSFSKKWENNIFDEKLAFSFVYFQCGVPDGGLVPKSLYKEEYSDKSPEGPPLSINSEYQTSYVVRDYPHEVSLIFTLLTLLEIGRKLKQIEY